MQWIAWSGILWLNVKVFTRFDLCFALLCFLLLTGAPLLLLVHSPSLLEPLYRPEPRQPALLWPEPGTVGWYIPRVSVSASDPSRHHPIEARSYAN